MSGIAKAALAAALLNCGLLTASAQDTAAQTTGGQWLKDGDCALFSASAAPGDSVTWTGACAGGYAEGLGTATFTHDGQSQSFTANFVHGEIPDGHVITRWGNGWSYDGETVGGRFNGAGILTTDAADRFEGQWSDGKMNGFGVLRRANGERYAGDWKNDRPNGKGELRHPDGSQIAGLFVDGKLAGTPLATKISNTSAAPSSLATKPNGAPFGSVSGKTLSGVDGSSIALTLIEGGMELQVSPADGGAARKTIFTFMTERMGTVVEDSGAPSQGSSVTGFFRLTGKGVEIRYADGHSAMLTAGADGGVQMTLDSDAGSLCRAWYPAGHSFSDAEKKMALNAYASKLGLAVAANDTSNGCSASAPAPQASNNPAAALPPAAPPAPATKPKTEAKPEKRARAKPPARMAALPQAKVAKASYRIGDYQPSITARTGLDSVAVKESQIHTIDSGIAVPSIGGALAMAPPSAAASTDKSDASRCLHVDSDGKNWGFRNSCDFAVQFSYCMAGGSNSLTACSEGAVITSATGSVAAKGFGALTPDNSLKEKDEPHNFRWVACGGGSGEVVAHLDRASPPSGRCERPRTASN